MRRELDRIPVQSSAPFATRAVNGSSAIAQAAAMPGQGFAAVPYSVDELSPPMIPLSILLWTLVLAPAGNVSRARGGAGMKYCTRCQEWKPLDAFHRNKKSHD